MSSSSFTIGELARRTGVSRDTVRYYERRGLLSAAPRGANGYRRYSEASVRHVRFVRNALRVGFSLAQVASFLRARESGRPPCRDVRAAAGRILEDLDRQLQELTASRSALEALLAEWDHLLAATPPGLPAGLLDRVVPDDLAMRAPRKRGAAR